MNGSKSHAIEMTLELRICLWDMIMQIPGLSFVTLTLVYDSYIQAANGDGEN